MTSVSEFGPKHVPATAQILPQLQIVVDFAVEHDLHGAVLVGDRLPAAGDIDDAQAPHAEADRIGHEKALIVGSAVEQRVGHPMHDAAGAAVPAGSGSMSPAMPHIPVSFRTSVGRACRGVIDEQAVPELDVDEGPQPRPAIDVAALVAIYQRLDVVRIEEAAAFERRWRQRCPGRTSAPPCRNHTDNGTGNPRFFRWMICGGSQARATFFSRYFRASPLTLRCAGTVAANSTSL